MKNIKSEMNKKNKTDEEKTKTKATIRTNTVKYNNVYVISVILRYLLIVFIRLLFALHKGGEGTSVRNYGGKRLVFFLSLIACVFQVY